MCGASYPRDPRRPRFQASFLLWRGYYSLLRQPDGWQRHSDPETTLAFLYQQPCRDNLPSSLCFLTKRYQRRPVTLSWQSTGLYSLAMLSMPNGDFLFFYPAPPFLPLQALSRCALSYLDVSEEDV